MKKIFLFIFTLIFLFSACSSNKDNELYESANAKLKANNYAEALKDYKKIIDEYPNSDKAAESFFAIAVMYHMYQIPNISKDESFKKAVEYYQKCYQQFPDEEKGAKALFMSGFILANEINNIDDARLAYKKFLEKYSSHELAPQAKIELDNLGKTPEEILQNNTVKK